MSYPRVKKLYEEALELLNSHKYAPLAEINSTRMRLSRVWTSLNDEIRKLILEKPRLRDIEKKLINKCIRVVDARKLFPALGFAFSAGDLEPLDGLCVLSRNEYVGGKNDRWERGTQDALSRTRDRKRPDTTPMVLKKKKISHFWETVLPKEETTAAVPVAAAPVSENPFGNPSGASGWGSEEDDW